MTNKEKQQLADWLAINNDINFDKYTITDKLLSYKNPPTLTTSTGRLSKSKIQRFIDKWGTVNVEPIQQISNINTYQLCIDISGSTSTISKEIEEGVNLFVENLAKQDNNAIVSIIEFGRTTYTINQNIPIKEWKGYKHKSPDDSTCINEVIFKSIDLVKKSVGQNTIIVFTDGDENVCKPTKEATKELIKNNKQIPIVFIGTGSRYAKELGIGEGYILTFQANREQTKRAFTELTEASKERIENVKKGKDVSGDAFFKTKTELATILKKSANIDMTVCYEKKMSKEQKEDNINKAKEYMKSILKGYSCDVKPDYTKLFDIMNTVEERTLFGKHDGTINEFGRYKFIEYNSKTPQNPIREVNPDTILWIEIQGKRYNKK